MSARLERALSGRLGVAISAFIAAYLAAFLATRPGGPQPAAEWWIDAAPTWAALRLVSVGDVSAAWPGVPWRDGFTPPESCEAVFSSVGHPCPRSSFFYSPAYLLLSAPLTWMPFAAFVRGVFWTNLAGVAAIAAWSARRMPPPARVPFALLFGAQFSVWESLHLGQNLLPAVGLALWATELLASRPSLGGALLAVAGTFKPWLALVWALPAVARSRAGVAGVGAMVAMSSVGAAWIWPGAWSSFANAVSEIGDGPLLSYNNAAVGAVTRRLVDPSFVDELARWHAVDPMWLDSLGWLPFGVALAGSWWTRSGLPRTTGVWIAAAALWPPISWDHYRVALVPATALLWARGGAASRGLCLGWAILGLLPLRLMAGISLELTAWPTLLAMAWALPTLLSWAIVLVMAWVPGRDESTTKDSSLDL